jgi:N-formylglutamate amidohydrolase
MPEEVGIGPASELGVCVSTPSHGLVPGVLVRLGPRVPRVPVVFDSPHSGCDYPDDFDHCLSPASIRTGVDAFVDELFGAAPAQGAVLLHALFPRTYIDPNRAPDDVDESLLDGPWPGGARPGPKTALGIGLIPRRQPAGAIYDRTLAVAEAVARLERFYLPYHGALRAALDGAHGAFGAVWHVNCHSMPALSSEVSPEGPGARRADFCLGDRDGSSCERDFTAFVAEVLSSMGYTVSVNDPYKGVELVRRYSDPGAGRHSLQIEVNRGLYMDERSATRADGFPALRADLDRLVEVVCRYALDRAGRQAAAE